MYKYVIVSFLSFLFLSLALLTPPPSYAATTIDLAQSDSFNLGIKITSDDGGQIYPMSVDADFDGDGKNDLVIGTYTVILSPLTLYGYVYFIPGSIIQALQGKGQTLDLADPQNYRIRWDGDAISYSEPAVGDINGDGRPDLVLGFENDNTYGLTGGPEAFIIYNDIIRSYSGTGNNIDLQSDTSAYTFNISLLDSETDLFYGNAILADLDNNGKDDLILGNAGYKSPCNHCGAVYIFRDSLFSTYYGVKKSLNGTNGSDFNIRYQMSAGGSPNLGAGLAVTDIDGNGYKDLITSAWDADPLGRTNAGSVFVVYDSLISTLTGTGNVVSIDASSNHNLQFIGPNIANYRLGGRYVDAGDVNQDGQTEIIMSAFDGPGGSYSSSVVGHLYLVPNNVFGSLTGTGNTIDMTDNGANSNYSVRYDGPTGGSLGGYYAYDLATDGFIEDINYDGKKDLVVADGITSYNGRDHSGSVYVFFSDLLASYTSRGTIVNLQTTDAFSYRFDGAEEYVGIGGVGYWGPGKLMYSDYNGDGRKDLLIGGGGNTPDSVRGFFIYNFPHSLSTSDFPTTNIGASFDFNGTVNAANSTSTIAGVQYQMDSNDPSGSWTACTANDASFDTTTESFHCEISGLTARNYTIYIRAFDSLGSYTAQASYLSRNFNPLNSSPVAGVPDPYVCSREKPTGTTELFQIDTEDATATLYFTPANNNVSGYDIVYGYTEGDERFGVSYDQGPSTGVLSYTIRELSPSTTYSFKVLPRNGCAVGDWSNWLPGKTAVKRGKAKSFYLYQKKK